MPDADRLQVTGLGAPQADTKVRGPAPAIAVLVVFVVFGFGCVDADRILALVRNWRVASAREQLAQEAHEAPAAQPRPTLVVPRTPAARDDATPDADLEAPAAAGQESLKQAGPG